MSDVRNPAALNEEIKELQCERERLIQELWRRERRPSVAVGGFLLLFGIVAIVLSIALSSYIMSFVGLGLVFLGVVSIYIRPVGYVQAVSLKYTASAMLRMADRLLKAYDIKGKGVYLPPLLISDMKDGLVFVNNDSSIKLPCPGELAEGKVLTDDPKGICLTASGLGLANLLEEKLGKSFTKVGLKYVKEKLPELFTDVLEIAETFEMGSDQDSVFVKARDSIFFGLCKQTSEPLINCDSYGCPFCSSIAIALARCLGKPVVVDRFWFFPKSKALELVYQVVTT